MRARLPLLFLSLFLLLQSSAQDYQPFPTESAKWEVVRCWYFFLPGWYDHYTIEMDGTDTLYADQVYKKLYITEHQYHGPEYDSTFTAEFFGGMREEDKQVFMFQSWASIDTTEHLVYDFNIEGIGDVIYTSALHAPPEFEYGHLVLEIDSVLIGAEYHKRYLLQDPDNEFNQEYWIEGVGSSWGLPFASFWSITDNSYDLTCFYDDEEHVYDNPGPTFGYCQGELPDFECEDISTSLFESSNSTELIVYPNPIETDEQNLRINSSLGVERLDIFDIAGNLAQNYECEGGIDEEISLSGLGAGSYLVMVYHSSSSVSRLILIVE